MNLSIQIYITLMRFETMGRDNGTIKKKKKEKRRKEKRKKKEKRGQKRKKRGNFNKTIQRSRSSRNDRIRH